MWGENAFWDVNSHIEETFGVPVHKKGLRYNHVDSSCSNLSSSHSSLRLLLAPPHSLRLRSAMSQIQPKSQLAH